MRPPPEGRGRAADLRLIEYFVAVVDHGGVTRAARALYIAPPSLSQAIRTLERRARVELPTAAGALRTVELWAQETVLVLPPELAAGLPDPVPLHALEDLPVVVESGAPPAGRVVVECAHRQAVWELVRHGAGAAFLP